MIGFGGHEDLTQAAGKPYRDRTDQMNKTRLADFFSIGPDCIRARDGEHRDFLLACFLFSVEPGSSMTTTR